MKELTYQELIAKDIFDLIEAPESMTETEKQALILKMYKIVENRVIARVIDKLDEAEIKEFTTNLKIGQKEANNYLMAKGIDFTKLVTEESLILKNELSYLVGNRSLK
jgi:predicted nucleotidyltransferase component of viral defense system